MKVEAKVLINNLNQILARNNTVVKIMEGILDNKQLKTFDFDGTRVSVYIDSKVCGIEHDVVDIDSSDDSIKIISKSTDELAYEDKQSIIKFINIKPDKFNGIDSASIESDTYIIFSKCFKHISTKLNVLNSGLETNYSQEISFYDSQTLSLLVDYDIDDLNYLYDANELLIECQKIVDKAFVKQIKATYRKDTYIDRLANNPIYARVVSMGNEGNSQYYCQVGYELGPILQHKLDSEYVLRDRPEPGDLSYNNLDINLDNIWQQYFDMEVEKTLVFDNFRRVF